MNTALEIATNLLGPDADPTLIATVHGISTALLLSKLKAYDATLTVTPVELDHILAELTVTRYNRIGSEGLKSETVEGRSATYSEDAIAPYTAEIEAWARRSGYLTDATDAPKVRFI